MVEITNAAPVLEGALFAEHGVLAYAVLDGASVPDLPQLLWEHEPQHVCLYRGELEPDLAAMAPYLVRLDRGGEFTNLVLNEGWGEHWGVFVLARQEVHFRDLRKHFRTFLRVRHPDGSSVYFRYYDPRVLQVFLPTCDASELGMIFGPVAAYLMESKKKDAVLHCSLVEGSLRVRTISPTLSEGGR